MNQQLLYAGGLILSIWGIRHLALAHNTVTGFRELTEDNRRIIIMKSIAEGLTIAFLGILTIIVTLMTRGDDPLARAVILYTAVMLLALAGLSLATGARTSILHMKLCPFIKASAAVLLIAGSM